jgi:hypothetical protein
MKKGLKFYCFSPPVMIATFVIELILALYLLFKYKLSSVTKLAVLMLVCLATFQLAEYGICEQLGFGGLTWAKIGFFAITLLPPLGVHLVHVIAGKKMGILKPVMYAGAALWIGFFLFGGLINNSVCHGNYVIFDIPEPFELLYYVFYDVLLLVAIGLATAYAHQTKKPHVRRALHSLAVGYLLFIVPSMIFVAIDSYTGANSPLPSIMCGFAVLLAVILAVKVVPESSNEKK